MRRGASIGLQILGLGALSCTLALGLRRGERLGCASAALAAEAPEILASPLGAPPRLAPLRPLILPSVPARLDVAWTAAGSFLGVRDDLLLRPILDGAPVKAKLNRGGSSISFRIDLDSGARIAFKPEQTDEQTVPRYEIAAYRINRLLGLNRVSPAVPKTFSYAALIASLTPESQVYLPRIAAEVIRRADGTVQGEASFWIPSIQDAGLDTKDGIHRWWSWLTVGEPIPPGKEALAEQISTLLAFDFLIDNSDRFSGGNALANEDGSGLYYMDNTLSFAYGKDATCKRYLAMAERYSRRLYVALRALREEDVRAALAAPPAGPWPILGESEIRSVMSRRDYLVDYIDGLIDVFGEREVLAFP